MIPQFLSLLYLYSIVVGKLYPKQKCRKSSPQFPQLHLTNLSCTERNVSPLQIPLQNILSSHSFSILALKVPNPSPHRKNFTSDQDSLVVVLLKLLLDRGIGSLMEKSPSPNVLAVSEGQYEDGEHAVCPSSGIFMQDSDPDLLGYYQKPASHVEEEFSEIDVFVKEEDDIGEEDEIEGYLIESVVEEEYKPEDDDVDFDFSSDWEEDEIEEETEYSKKELNKFGTSGLKYGNINEENFWKPRKKLSKSERKRRIRDESKKLAEVEPTTVYACCHSLRNYNTVKNQKAENLILDVKLDHLISTQLMRLLTSTLVVVMVVDYVDVDGSFPKCTMKSLFEAMEKNKIKISRFPKLILVGMKLRRGSRKKKNHRRNSKEDKY